MSSAFAQHGRAVDDVIADLVALRADDVRWRDGRTFGLDTTSAVLLDREGGEQVVPEGTKHALADAVWDAVALRLRVPGGTAPAR